MTCKARQGKARQGKARQGKARQGKAGQGRAGQGKANARHSEAHADVSRARQMQGTARHTQMSAGQGKAGHKVRSKARQRNLQKPTRHQPSPTPSQARSCRGTQQPKENHQPHPGKSLPGTITEDHSK